MTPATLPERYIVVTAVPNKIGPKKCLYGIVDTQSESNALFIFAKDHTYQYTEAKS